MGKIHTGVGVAVYSPVGRHRRAGTKAGRLQSALQSALDRGVDPANDVEIHRVLSEAKAEYEAE